MIDNLKKCNRSPKDKYSFSVVIPTWNNLAYFKLCISSLLKNSSLDIQIIAFLNEGKDGTREWLDTQDNIDYIQSDKNIGICASMNLCRSLVKSDYIIYINDDMYLLPGWDTVMFEETKQMNTKLFMLSSTMIEPFDTGNSCVVVSNYGDAIENFKEDLLLKEFSKHRTNDWSGSTWPPSLVHIDLWDTIGGFSIDFHPGMGSDNDFSKKLYDVGVRIFKGLGNSLVYHFGSKSTKKLNKNNGRKQFIYKWRISWSFFSKQILKLGKPYEGLASESKPTAIQILVNKLKLIKFILISK